MAAINPTAGDSAKALAATTPIKIKKYMNDLINYDDKYTIIATQFQYGQLLKPINKEDVRSECEKIRKLYEFSKRSNDNKIYCQIEVVNNQTGEIREYWNSEQKQILF